MLGIAATLLSIAGACAVQDPWSDIELHFQVAPLDVTAGTTAVDADLRLFAHHAAGVLQVWDIAAGTKVLELSLPVEPIALEFWGREHLIVRERASTWVIDLHQPTEVNMQIEFAPSAPLDIATCPTGVSFVFGGVLPNGEQATFFGVGGKGGNEPLSYFPSPGELLAVAPSGDLVAALSNTDAGAELHLLEVPTGTVRVLELGGGIARDRSPRISPCESMLAAAVVSIDTELNASYHLVVIDVESMQAIGHRMYQRMPSFAFSPDEPILHVVTVGEEQSERLWVEDLRFSDLGMSVDGWEAPCAAGWRQGTDVHNAMRDGAVVLTCSKDRETWDDCDASAFVVVDLERRREAWRVDLEAVHNASRQNVRMLVEEGSGAIVVTDEWRDLYRWNLAMGSRELIMAASGADVIAIDGDQCITSDAGQGVTDPIDPGPVDRSVLEGLGVEFAPLRRHIDYSSADGAVVLAGPSGICVVHAVDGVGRRVVQVPRDTTPAAGVDEVLALESAGAFVVVRADGGLEFWGIDEPRLLQTVRRSEWSAGTPSDDSGSWWWRRTERGPSSSKVLGLAHCAATETLYVVGEFGLEAFRVDSNGIADTSVHLTETPGAAVAVNRSGTRIAVRGEAGVTLLDPTGSVVALMPAHGPNWLSVAFAESDELVAIETSDGVTVCDGDDGRFIARLFAGPTSRRDDDSFGDALIATSDRVLATRAGARIIDAAWRTHPLPSGGVDESLNRPSSVLAELGRADERLLERWRRVEESRDRRRGSPALEDLLFVTTELRRPAPRFIEEKTLDIEVVVEPWLRALHLRVGGVPVTPPGGRTVTDEERRDGHAIVSVDLERGTNHLWLVGADASGRWTLPTHVRCHRIDADESVTRTFFLGVGVSDYADDSFDLQYAARDVLAFEEALRNVCRGPVVSRTFVDGAARRDRILDAASMFDEATIDDTIVVFLAGHGVVDALGTYRFADHEFAFKDPAQSGGITHVDLERLIGSSPARRRLVLIDTCHAGEAEGSEGGSNDPSAGDREGRRGFGSAGGRDDGEDGFTDMLVEEAFMDMRVGIGATVIAASGYTEHALERDALSHGVFTHTLLRGFAEGDANEDGAVTVGELRTFVAHEVRRLTLGAQRPRLRRENIERDTALVAPWTSSVVHTREVERRGQRFELLGLDPTETFAVATSEWEHADSFATWEVGRGLELRLVATGEVLAEVSFDEPRVPARLDTPFVVAALDGSRILAQLLSGRRFVASAPFDAWVELEAPLAGLSIYSTPMLSAAGRYLAWVKDEGLVTLGDDGAFCYLDLDTGEQRTIELGGRVRAVAPVRGSDSFDLVIVHFDGRALVEEVVELDLRTGALERFVLGHIAKVGVDIRAVEFLASGSAVAAGERRQGGERLRSLWIIDPRNASARMLGEVALDPDHPDELETIVAWIDGCAVTIGGSATQLAHWRQNGPTAVRVWQRSVASLTGATHMEQLPGSGVAEASLFVDGTVLLLSVSTMDGGGVRECVLWAESGAPRGTLPKDVGRSGQESRTPRGPLFTGQTSGRLFAIGTSGSLYSWDLEPHS
jgi:hypothetical protein